MIINVALVILWAMGAATLFETGKREGVEIGYVRGKQVAARVEYERCDRIVEDLQNECTERDETELHRLRVQQ